MSVTSLRRLVFVHSSDEMYGADRVLLHLFEALTPREREQAEFWLPTDVATATYALSAELKARGATVQHVDLPILRRAYRTPAALLRLARRWFGTWRRLRATRPELVYLATSATYLCAPAARLARSRRVVGHKQEMWSARDRRVLAPCARVCDCLVAISDPVRDNLPPALRDRTRVVLNATVRPLAVAPLERRDGPLVFTVASRWNRWKGHSTLLRAWDLAGSPGELIVLGDRPPSGESVDVRELVAQLRQPATVTVVGEVPDIGPYLDATDVLVVPSDDPEPFGLVAIEAFARARPVIGSAAGGLAEVVHHGHEGWTFPPGNPDALAEIIRKLDREAVITAGRNARFAYESRYTPERFAVEWRAAVGLP